ncbi:hypothetical protein ACHAP5_012067 [Fusarium lateritium]
MTDNDNNNNSSSNDEGKEKEDARSSPLSQDDQRRSTSPNVFRPSSQHTDDCGNSSPAPAPMSHGATRLPDGHIKLETWEMEVLGAFSYGFVDKNGGKPTSVVARLDIPGCMLAMGGVDDSTKAMLEAWRMMEEARPGKQISWMVFVDEDAGMAPHPSRGSKRDRDVETDDSDVRPAKAPKLPAPKQPDPHQTEIKEEPTNNTDFW